MHTTTQLTLPHVLRSASTEYAGRTAVIDGSVRLTYAQLHAQVRLAARALAALGVEPRDRVCVWAPNSWHWLVMALAATYQGAVLVPINSRYTGHEALDIIHRTRAKTLVVADGFLGRQQYQDLCAAAAASGEDGGKPIDGLPYLAAVVRIMHPGATPVDTDGVVDIDALSDVAENATLDEIERRADAVAPDDVADILFTSGTTGRSKGACSAHRQTIGVAQAWAEMGEVTSADRYLLVNPFFHTFGYKAGIVVALLNGATILPQAVFDLDETLRLIVEEKVTLLAGAPPIYQALLDAPDRARRDTSSLRLAVTGATLVPVALVERMQAELGFDVVLTAYGLTEAVVATMCRPGDPDELVASTVGRAVRGFELRIAAPGGNRALPAGAEGEVLLRGENVMLGYLEDPVATAEAIDDDGWLHTGDIGQVDEQGYLKITDRLKDVFLVGGFNVYPAEVEQSLARLPGVTESAVIGVPDERLGEVGKAYVVRRADSTLTADEVIAYCRERLANFKVPRHVSFVDALPRNASGKILKRELRDSA